MKKHQVILIFRKLRETGNFSMETSFERMVQSFPKDSNFELRKFTSSHFSNGLIPRILGILEARKNRGDINHMTGDAHYLVLGLPGKRTILTIHDCGLMEQSNPLKRFILRLVWLNLPVRHCSYVTAVSEATKQDIIHFTGCKPDKVVVIPTIIAETFQKAEKSFNQECPRILHIGLAPNKNFKRHIEAISELNCELHIIGKLDTYHEETLKKYGVKWTSEYNISQNEMQRAYAESDMLLFASTLEGFGMPILEAQTVGRPVITSNISSMPEVAGEGACLVDPYDVQSIRKGISKVIENNLYRESLVDKGFDNIKRYHSDSVARQYETLYARVLGS